MLGELADNTFRLDVHQHVWSAELVDALAARDEPPLVRRERGLDVLYLERERPCVIDHDDGAGELRLGELAECGLDAALVAISSPLGVESLAPAEADPLIDAFLEGALALGPQFGVWGPVPVRHPAAVDVDRALDAGCVGISLPAGSLAGVEDVARLDPVLRRTEERDVPLFVHPGPGPGARRGGLPSLLDPLWWPALTEYVAQMHAAYLAFATAGRPARPSLRVVFALLAGLAPLHAERLTARGARLAAGDENSFFETSSYGPRAARALTEAVGGEQLLYGSDRPVVARAECRPPQDEQWPAFERAAARAFPALAPAAAGETAVLR